MLVQLTGNEVSFILDILKEIRDDTDLHYEEDVDECISILEPPDDADALG